MHVHTVRSGPTVAIATCTLYDMDHPSDACRAALALRTVEEATALGYHIVVVDGGSPRRFTNELRERGAVLLQQERPGMGASRRQAIRACLRTTAPVIAYLDPEKHPYLGQLHRTIEPILAGACDVVVPRRRSLRSYPTAQQHSEAFINAFWRDLTSTDLDVMFGPRSWRRGLSSYFLDYDGEYGDRWDCIFVPLVDLWRDGWRMSEVVVDYEHPPAQTAAEEADRSFFWKRMDQATLLMKAIESRAARARARPRAAVA